MLECVLTYAHGGSVSTHSVLEKEKATEEAEEISCKQGEVNCCGAGHVDHHRHAAVQCIHTHSKPTQKQS